MTHQSLQWGRDLAEEGTPFTLSGSFTDPDTGDSWTATVDYGDGSGVQFLALSGKDFELNRTYADDGIYEVSVTVTDTEGESDCDTLTITANNVAPTIALSGPASVAEGSVYTLMLGAVTDPGDDTVYEWIVHWGDGGTDTYRSGADVTHIYADGPTNPTIVVDLVDEDGTHPGCGTLDVVTIAPGAVDTLVRTTLGSTRYDLRTGRTSVLMTITNVSPTAIRGPLWVVITSISDPGVTLASYSGTTSDHYLYVDVSSLLSGGWLEPGQSVSVWLSFNNPFRRRFNFLYSIRGVL